ncbi:MAG: sugar ABC transporter permease [Lachnospiraceae bacterium]|nr:sugar ABC transporter permease [Lachnospiraceae bacterium]
MAAAKRSKVVSYTKWGYIFLIPFFLVYTVFSLVPLISTVYYSFFERYMAMGGLTQVGPNFIGIQNYITMITGGGASPEMYKYAWNTLVMWLMGFIPQILVSLLLGVWFADTQIRLKGDQFFKTVIYLPNVIMASAFAMIFFMIFSDIGPVNNIIEAFGGTAVRWLTYTWTTRLLVALMNFLMWFGNTTITLMAGIMGIDTSLFEAASVDGANSIQTFTRITMPLLKPIFIYTLITSLIGGIQMFDVPQILTNGAGSPNNTTMTLIMWLNKHLYSKNYGTSGALSVILFIVTGILSMIIFRMNTRNDEY